MSGVLSGSAMSIGGSGGASFSAHGEPVHTYYSIDTKNCGTRGL